MMINIQRIQKPFSDVFFPLSTSDKQIDKTCFSFSFSCSFRPITQMRVYARHKLETGIYIRVNRE